MSQTRLNFPTPPPRNPAVETDAFTDCLLNWYDATARELPWRIPPGHQQTPDPYHVWLSEIMLQQTTVATVKSRFEIFTQTWPTVQSLAAAPIEDVLAAWAGLGYYARARNLHKCAKTLVEESNGQFPNELNALKALPGIGDYTANAIRAIAFNLPAVVVDGNIERITSRLYREETALPAAKPKLKSQTSSYWPGRRHGDFAQALMDLGATICRPKSPLCGGCPISQFCQAQAMGDPEAFPKKEKKRPKPTREGKVYILMKPVDGDGAFVALERRPPSGLLGGMLGFPGTQWREQNFDDAEINEAVPVKVSKNDHWDEIGEVRHTFTHFHLKLIVFRKWARAKDKPPNGLEWHDVDTVRLPTVMNKVLAIGVK